MSLRRVEAARVVRRKVREVERPVARRVAPRLQVTRFHWDFTPGPVKVARIWP